jgi:hypothetical protein
MGSLVHDLQNDLRKPGKTVVEVLRTAKLISSKLGLKEISGWLDAELNGYASDAPIPAYRNVSGGRLEAYNPAIGRWLPAGDVSMDSFPNRQPIAELEELAKSKELSITPQRHYPLNSFAGAEGIVNQFPQRVVISSAKIRTVLEGVKDKLLDWAIELEQRGVLGENMSFDEKEKQSAKGHVFHIQNATGIFGNVSNSQVTVYDYSSIHQNLKDAGVPQKERNEIEDILDELKSANPQERKSLLEKGKEWVVKNEQLLGAGASIIRKALGLPGVD